MGHRSESVGGVSTRDGSGDVSIPARPANAVALFERLAQWGEVAAYEVTELRVSAWISVFEGAGVLTAVDDVRGRPVAWHLAPRFVALLESGAQQIGRRLCFAVPEYRAYLVSILIEGLAGAARASMSAELEDWTGAELAPLLPELNAFLDKLESGTRLVDLGRAEFEERMSNLAERARDFSGWDAFTLGQSAHPKILFEFALRRFGPVSGPPPVVEDPAVVLRALSLNREDGFDLGDTSLPAPWNTQRFGILGCVAVFDAGGQRLFDEEKPLTDELFEHLRDSILEHPFYRPVVHLAICAWRSPASTIPPVELYVPASWPLHDASVLLGSRDMGRLADLLGGLVRMQGYAPFGLVDGRVSDKLMGNLLRNLLDLRILQRQDEFLILHEGYQSSLMAGRLRTVFRPGKNLQKRMVEELAGRTSTRGVA